MNFNIIRRKIAEAKIPKSAQRKRRMTQMMKRLRIVTMETMREAR
jgi:hypothetical protein